MEKVTAEEIHRRMRELRGDLRHDMQEVAADMRSVSDWKFYVRRFPWTTVAAVIAAGYFVVPRRREIISPDAETLAALAKREHLIVKPRRDADSSKSLANTLGTMAATGLARAAIAYAGQQLGSTAAKPHQPQTPQGSSLPR